MLRKMFIAVPLLALSGAVAACPDLIDFNKRELAGEEQFSLCDRYAGKVVLIVNTASKCGYTPQYEGLETLYRRYRDRGQVVLGVPNIDFGGREPDTEQQVQKFCRLTYGVDFPMFEKTRVRKGAADPLYLALARESGEYPRSNFHECLLDRQGQVVGSFRSSVEPLSDEMAKTIESLLLV